jgi:transcriptional regulator with XRE-family HTH domain/Zn-dependent peptidase ImmA (M78 family)
MPGRRDSDIGRRIAELRESRGWSQRALAKMIGVDQSVLSRIESGKRRLGVGELTPIADALGVDVKVLLAAAHAGDADEGSERARDAGTGGAPFEAAAWADPHDGPPLLRRDDTPPSARRSEAGRSRRVEAPLHRPDRDSPNRLMSPRDEARQSRESYSDGIDLPPAEARRRQADERRVFAKMGPPVPSELSENDLLAETAPPKPLPRLLPPPAERVIDDYLRLRGLAGEAVVWASAPPSSDAFGRRRPASASRWSLSAQMGVGESRDRYARFLRHELGIGVDGPVPDLVALFEDARVAEVVVARLQGETPVAVSLVADGTAFVFVNAVRPVTLQRFALVHAAAHLVLGHGDVVDERIQWSRGEPLESEANDFAEEFLAPVIAVARWYDRHGDPRPDVDVLLDLAAAFGITPWSALYRSRAAERLHGKLQSMLTHELKAREWALLPQQALRGGLRDTLSSLSEEAPAPLAGTKGVGGVPAPDHLTRDPGPPAVLRVPGRMHRWALQAVGQGRLSLEQAARMLHRQPDDFAAELTRLGIE